MEKKKKIKNDPVFSTLHLKLKFVHAYGYYSIQASDHLDTNYFKT